MVLSTLCQASMDIIAISDTHGQHEKLELPQGDMIIHAGDISSRGTQVEVKDFLEWYGNLNFNYKIFIAGNHDFYFEGIDPKAMQYLLPDDLIYLNDSSVVIEGIKIWGSPIQPRFYDWAFNRNRGSEIQRHWDLIPKDTDILITHGPPYQQLDLTINGDHAGCRNLSETLKTLSVKLHIFGHIHEAYGIQKQNRTTFINASNLNHNYQLSNKPIVYQYERSPEKKF